MLYFIKFPLIDKYMLPSDTTLKIVVFLLLSYVVGTIIQESSSFFLEKLRKHSRQNFLNKNSKIFQHGVLNEVQKFANIEFGKDINNDIFSEDENESLFFKAKAVLENLNKIKKADKFDAIFAMSRDFIVVNICVVICCIINILNPERLCLHIIIVLYSLITLPLFFRRAKRYAEMRVRTIIRQYMSIKVVNEEAQN